MKFHFFLALAIFSITASAQNFVKVNTAPVNETGNDSWASAWGDYDNDGHMDLYVSNYFAKNFLYRNNGDKTFTKVTTGNLVLSESVGHWSSTWVDYDDDGDLDMYVVNSYTSLNELLRNNGNGTFTSVASAITNTGLTDDNNASWADTDNDGDLDLFLANGSNSTPEKQNENDSFFINNGNGTFTQNTTSPIATSGGLSQHGAFGDYDNDGDADLFVVNIFGDNFFFENKGGNTFERKLGLPFLSTGEQPYAAVWGDFNNDMYMDLVVASYLDTRIYYNNGNKTFHTGTFPGIGGNANSVSAGDFNLDGLLDALFVRTSQGSLLYLNNGDETFTNTPAGELTLTTLDFTHSGALADYDNDGDLDVYINNDDSPNLLFENTDLVGQHWLSAKLVGATSNSQGIGAKVWVRTGTTWQAREITVLGSFRTQNSVLAHFGLGTSTQADVVRVEWPSGEITVLKNIAADQQLTINEVNTPTNVAHTMSTIEIEVDEDSEVSFNPADFLDAFHDDEGDRLKKIDLTQRPNDGKLFYDGVEVVGNLEILVADIGKLKFKPDPDFFGDFSLQYSAMDSRNADSFSTNEGMIIHMTVNAVNDPPSIQPIADIDKNVLEPGEIIEFSFEVFDIDTDPLDLEISVDPDDADFTPVANFELENIDENLRLYRFEVVRGGSAMVTIKVSDGDNEVSTSFNMTINMAHSLDVDFNVAEDEQLNFTSDDFTDNFVDAEDDVLGEMQITAVPGHGALYLNSEEVLPNDILFVGDLDNLTYVPDQDYNGVDHFSYDAVDTRAFRVNFTSDIIIAAVNDEPKITSLISIDQEVRPTQNAEVEIHFADVDTPLGQLTVTAVADNTTVAPEQDIEFIGTGYERIFRLKAKQPGSTVITVTVTDGTLSAETEFAIVVLPNTPLSLSVNFEITEDGFYAFKSTDFTENTHDAEGDDLVKIKINKLPTHGTLKLESASVVVGDVIAVAELANLRYTPAKDFDGEDKFEYSAMDELDLATACVSKINVKPVNDAPVLTDVDDMTIGKLTDGDVVNADVHLTDVDNVPNELTLTASTDNAGVLSSVTINGSGEIKTLNLKVVKGGTTTITLIATDGDLVTIQTFKLTVVSVVTGLEEGLGDLITVYPNPVIDRMNIDAGSVGGEMSFEIVDGIGRVLKQGSMTDAGVDVEDMAAGVYLVKCKIRGRIWVKKVVKR